jgi:hypothetical protein
MNEHFCTYFDHRYATKGLAMWKSLKRANASATLHVLCLNDACHEILSGLQLADVRLYPVRAVENADPELLQARSNRSLVEYYFTLTPCLPLHVFRTHPEIPRLTYVDADLLFFADPRPILDEVGDDAVGIVEHRFPIARVDLERYGRFNVGWLTFRNDPVAFECLRLWREQCLEWCYDRTEPGRFAEQKYLDEWPDRFGRICIIQHAGANVAPWNLNRFDLSLQGEELRVDGEPLIFFHAHGFQPASAGRPRALNLEQYGVKETPLLSGRIFDAYEKALVEATDEIAAPLALALLTDQPRETVYLQEALAASEADRAARLDVIHALQDQLRASIDDRAAQSAVIHSLRHQLEVSERDRAARAETIRSLQQRLDAMADEIVLTRAHLEQVRSRVHDMEHSRTWRWTRLARWLAGRFLQKRTGRA